MFNRFKHQKTNYCKELTVPEGCVELTGNILFKINGGDKVENSVEAQSKAKEGDTIERKDGTTHTLTQGDINWAKEQVANSGGGTATATTTPATATTGATSTTATTGTGSGSSSGGSGSSGGSSEYHRAGILRYPRIPSRARKPKGFGQPGRECPCENS